MSAFTDPIPVPAFVVQSSMVQSFPKAIVIKAIGDAMEYTRQSRKCWPASPEAQAAFDEKMRLEAIEYKFKKGEWLKNNPGRTESDYCNYLNSLPREKQRGGGLYHCHDADYERRKKQDAMDKFDNQMDLLIAMLLMANRSESVIITLSAADIAPIAKFIKEPNP